ncbi:MAG: formate/nitrite transporter family protein, partial [Candidatus Methanomethylophilaceae archaeon]|nr:formate/nitrite transporter family protein [Candidatus Methanomethylophilaceae archaeon]
SDLYTVFNTLMKGVMCGMLMFIAVDFYKTKGSYIATFVAVPVFIMAGFEHSIADMFYFSSAMMWDLDAVIFILIIIVGNALGGMLIPAYRLFVNGEREKKAKAESQ